MNRTTHRSRSDRLFDMILLAQNRVALVCVICFLGCSFCDLNRCAAETTRQFIGGDRWLLGTETKLSASVRLGDLDGDGDLDVAVANGRHWPQQNFLLFNQAAGRFNVQRPLGIDRRTSYATELADLDGDGDLDVAVGNDMAPNQVFINDGRGQFVAGSKFGSLSSVRSLTLADVDGDNDIDVLATSRGRPNQIYLNDGQSNFSAGIRFGEADDSTIDVAVGDLDGDGDLDFALANRDRQQNFCVFNDRDLTFNRRVPFGSGSDETRALAIGDMNGDGKLDLIAGNIGQSNGVFLADGGAWKDFSPFGRTDGRTYALSLADLDNDQDLDVVVGNVGQPNAAFFNAGDGKTFTEVRFGAEDGATYGIDLGDLDQDGFVDVVTANSGATNRVYFNRPRRRESPQRR